MAASNTCSCWCCRIIVAACVAKLAECQPFDMFEPAAFQHWGPNTQLAAHIDEAGRPSTKLSENPVPESLLDVAIESSADAASAELPVGIVHGAEDMTAARLMRVEERQADRDQSEEQQADPHQAPTDVLEEKASLVETELSSLRPLMCKAKKYKDGSPLCSDGTPFFQNGQNCSIACKVSGSYGLGWFYTPGPFEEIGCECKNGRCDWVPALPHVKCAVNPKRVLLTCAFVAWTLFIMAFGCVYSRKEKLSTPKEDVPEQ